MERARSPRRFTCRKQPRKPEKEARGRDNATLPWLAATVAPVLCQLPLALHGVGLPCMAGRASSDTSNDTRREVKATERYWEGPPFFVVHGSICAIGPGPRCPEPGG
ncbi:hypothetical protein BDA96_01G322200 [Sorghum bicolor]|uniref:Uncharacterized protein n=2 Tax=Sorghum bicolor TaxID=4558 RepID=A0A921S2N2_SORBI|nr:hypothetical protein BDA96_01G322200 [Sorghum bicolor]OQU92138.1 hypothetical protein SORBI_3001G298032 [Sorghum bicolor]